MKNKQAIIDKNCNIQKTELTKKVWNHCLPSAVTFTAKKSCAVRERKSQKRDKQLKSYIWHSLQVAS